MGWRSVIITQHAKLTYSMNMMIVQTKDGSILHVCGDDPKRFIINCFYSGYSPRMWR